MYRFLALTLLLSSIGCFSVDGALLRGSGAVQTSLDGRIVGGLETTIQHFPHQVSLQRDSTHICGASILNETLIITAAHCVTEYRQPQQYTIRAGSTEHGNGGVLVQVSRIIPHEHYNAPTSLNNDIALIALQQPLSFSSSIKPIPMVSPEDAVSASAPLFVSGWGALSSAQQMITSRLRYTIVHELDHTNCVRSYRGMGTVTQTMLCAGLQGGGRDSCQGDSGGPLITPVQGVMKLLGVVSWGIGCAHPNYPGVYTRVADYAQWVQKTAEKLQ